MRTAINFLFLSLLLAGGSGCGKGPERSRDGYLQVAGSPSMVVAKVGEHEISRRDLAREVNSKAGILLARGDTPPDNFEESILQRMISSELLYQLGEKSVSEAARKPADEKYEETLAAFSSEAALAEALARQGLTLEEYRANLKKQYVVILFLDQEVHSKLKFSEEEIANYYREHPEQFPGKEGKPQELAEVRDQVLMLLSAPRSLIMVDELLARAKEQIPVQVYYPGENGN